MVKGLEDYVSQLVFVVLSNVLPVIIFGATLSASYLELPTLINFVVSGRL